MTMPHMCTVLLSFQESELCIKIIHSSLTNAPWQKYGNGNVKIIHDIYIK